MPSLVGYFKLSSDQCPTTDFEKIKKYVVHSLLKYISLCDAYNDIY